MSVVVKYGFGVGSCEYCFEVWSSGSSERAFRMASLEGTGTVVNLLR